MVHLGCRAPEGEAIESALGRKKMDGECEVHRHPIVGQAHLEDAVARKI
jgi:hypothetical protein